MNEVVVGRREMHLAAYMKFRGATLVKGGRDGFVFETDRSLDEWRVEHGNSCCLQVDRELLTLKHFLAG